MKKNFFITIFVVFCVLILPNKGNSYSSDPKEFIQEVVDEAKKILVKTNSKEFKTKELSKMALQTVDIKGVAYYTLGKYRKKLNDEQMNEYLKLFEKYFLKSFTSRLTDYTKNPSKPLIRDLIVEGLSLARTQKEEFTSVIESNNGDVTKLFITLKEFINK